MHVTGEICNNISRSDMANQLMGAYPAPPFPEGLDWIHSGGKALTLEDFRGKIVMLDFWTYG